VPFPTCTLGQGTLGPPLRRCRGPAARSTSQLAGGSPTPSVLIHGPKLPLRIPWSTPCAWTVAQSSRASPLRCEAHRRHAVGVEADAEHQLRRCPDLRGPTPTKRCCGQAKEADLDIPSTTTWSIAETLLPGSPQSGTSLPCQGERSSTDTIPPRSPCVSSAARLSPRVGRGISCSTLSVDLGGVG
jgi:hypothetical protein